MCACARACVCTLLALLLFCRYVKYLYPYECETVQLSEPQELQMAIDSNKRDRRHSDNMEFVAPQLGGRGEMELCPSPVVTTTPQGVQLISSPTMALPHGSIPPYSGGFLMSGGPGGSHMVASPQLVQMSPHLPGIPIVIPSNSGILHQTVGGPPPPSSSSSSSASSSSSSLEEREDTQSHASGEILDGSQPLPKRPALEGKVTLPQTNGQTYTNNGGLVVTHGGNIVHSSGGPHLIQMGTHGQIPIVVPAAPISSAPSQLGQHAFQVNSKADVHPKSENGSMTVATLQSHPGRSGNMIVAQRGSPLTAAPTRAIQNLFQMTGHPGVVSPHQISIPPSASRQDERRGNSADSDKSSATPQPSLNKMPVANISIESGLYYVCGWLISHYHNH